MIAGRTRDEDVEVHIGSGHGSIGSGMNPSEEQMMVDGDGRLRWFGLVGETTVVYPKMPAQVPPEKQ